jgi:ubiquinone/menaquinone biosynthesis C-methylase UbiE
MNERTYNRKIDKLRSSERIKLIEVERVIEFSLKGLKPQNILDVGTGSGLFAEAFAEKGLKVSGIDVNPEMIQAVKEFVPKGEFITAPAEKIPFPDKTFDMVFLGFILHEADDQLKAIREAKRTAGKRIIILEWPYLKEEIGPPLEHRISKEKIFELCEKSGLKGIKTIQLNHMILFIIDP